MDLDSDYSERKLSNDKHSFDLPSISSLQLHSNNNFTHQDSNNNSAHQDSTSNLSWKSKNPNFVLPPISSLHNSFSHITDISPECNQPFLNTKPVHIFQTSQEHPIEKKHKPNNNQKTNSENNVYKIKAKKSVTGIPINYCVDCKTTQTPLWRRDLNGNQVSLNQILSTINIPKAESLSLNQHHPLTVSQSSPTKGDFAGSNENQTSNTMDQKAEYGSDQSNTCVETCPGNGSCNGKGGSISCGGCPTFNQKQIHSGNMNLDRRFRVKKHKLDSEPANEKTVCFNCKTDYTPLWRRDDGNNTICNACGLYYKLHGHHRPVSMKRSVIKRRTRIPHTNKNYGSSSPIEQEHIFPIEDYDKVERRKIPDFFDTNVQSKNEEHHSSSSLSVSSSAGSQKSGLNMAMDNERTEYMNELSNSKNSLKSLMLAAELYENKAFEKNKNENSVAKEKRHGKPKSTKAYKKQLVKAVSHLQELLNRSNDILRSLENEE
ncbi:hypothetical protein BB559_006843 [Furculomyces boomerangus]|uniref:GATA-type domain-containing protein n=1 Tax=Furculomyces boomerangus TaxID=61424 RepID=A0A2T9Y067_9FUNG|nr:hypothetical protein BB559_006843 [Furculomyces boomerangus]